VYFCQTPELDEKQKRDLVQMQCKAHGHPDCHALAGRSLLISGEIAVGGVYYQILVGCKEETWIQAGIQMQTTHSGDLTHQLRILVFYKGLAFAAFSLCLIFWIGHIAWFYSAATDVHRTLAAAFLIIVCSIVFRFLELWNTFQGRNLLLLTTFRMILDISAGSTIITVIMLSGSGWCILIDSMPSSVNLMTVLTCVVQMLLIVTTQELSHGGFKVVFGVITGAGLMALLCNFVSRARDAVDLIEYQAHAFDSIGLTGATTGLQRKARLIERIIALTSFAARTLIYQGAISMVPGLIYGPSDGDGQWENDAFGDCFVLCLVIGLEWAFLLGSDDVRDGGEDPWIVKRKWLESFEREVGAESAMLLPLGPDGDDALGFACCAVEKDESTNVA
jgi:hypothetical protein